MKIINYILSIYLFVGLISFSSCSDEDELFLQRDTDIVEFEFTNSTKNLTIVSNGEWKVSSEDSWITLSPESGVGDGKTQQHVEITVTRNSGEKRMGTVNLYNQNVNLTIDISQEDGFFSLGKPIMEPSYIIDYELINEKILIPYTKALAGDIVNVTASLEGAGAEGLSIESLSGFVLETTGEIPLYITGTPTKKGEIQVKIHIEVTTTGETYDLVAEGNTKLEGEIVVKMFKLLPRLAVLDWGDYAKGTGTCGDNGTSRQFILELSETKDGGAIRRYENQVNWLTTTSTANLPTFYEHNRFTFANLKPNTTYWFRIVARGLGANKDQDSDVTYFEFKTPEEEPLGPDVILYKDFDTFWWGGSAIYQSFAVQPTEAQIGANLDPNSESVLATDYRTTYPVNNLGNMFGQANNSTHNLSPAKCPALWNYYWEGDKYGTNYGDADYPGWQGSQALPNTGGIRLATASAAGYIKTPKLSAIGSGSVNITVTVNSAPYFEPYHNWGEDHLQHYIIVEGPGTITDGGPTQATPIGAATPNSSTQITVQCTSNVNSSTKGPAYNYTIPTEHKVKISGATKDTRIVIQTHPYSGTAHYRMFIDDIKITKD